MNWLFDIFSGGVKKEAELTNEQTEFDRKVEANDWIKEAMNIDEAELTKEAAYEVGDTQEDTIKKDYELALSGLSDYNLAEMIAELKCSNDLLATLDFNEEKEKALKSIGSNRKSIEKKLLDLVGEHTSVDWKEAFKKFEEVDVVHPKDKDLYEQMPSGKWRKKTKFSPVSDKEKVEQMAGVGKEEEKGALAKDASLKTASDAVEPSDAEFGVGFESVPELSTELPVETPLVETPLEDAKPKLDDKITTKIEEKIEEKAEDIAVKIEEKIEEHADEMAAKVEEKIEQKIDEAFNAGPVVTEDSTEDKVLDKLQVPHLEPGETPKSEMKEWKEDKEDKPKEDKKDDKKDDKKKDKKKDDKDEDKKDDKKDDKEEKSENPFDKESALKCPKCKSTNVTPASGHKLNKCDSCHLAFDSAEESDKEASLKVKSFRAGDKGFYHGKPATIKDMYLNTFSGDATMEIECEGKVVHISGKELKNLNNEPLMEGMETEQAPAAPAAEIQKKDEAPEIMSKASRADVIKKFALLSVHAEIESPWRVVKNDKGEDIVARVAPTLREKKSREKNKKVDIQSKENI